MIWFKGTHTVNRTSFSIFKQKGDYFDILHICIHLFTLTNWWPPAPGGKITINRFIHCRCSLGGKVEFCTFLKVTLTARLQGPGLNQCPLYYSAPWTTWAIVESTRCWQHICNIFAGTCLWVNVQFCFIRFWINVHFPGSLWLISLKVGLL